MRYALLVHVAIIFSCAASCLAQAQQGDWEISFALTGGNDRDFNDTAIGLNAAVGYFAFENFEISLRQTFAYSSIADSSAGVGSTQGAVDYFFPLGDQKQWQPFIGANVEYAYGDVVSDHFEAGPEAGVKYYLNSTTFIYLRGEYQIFFGENIDSSDRQWVYSAGIGFRF